MDIDLDLDQDLDQDQDQDHDQDHGHDQDQDLDLDQGADLELDNNIIHFCAIFFISPFKQNIEVNFGISCPPPTDSSLLSLDVKQNIQQVAPC